MCRHGGLRCRGAGCRHHLWEAGGAYAHPDAGHRWAAPQNVEDGALGVADRRTRLRRIVDEAPAVLSDDRVAVDRDGADVGAVRVQVQLGGGEVDAALADRLPCPHFGADVGRSEYRGGNGMTAGTVMHVATEGDRE